MAAPVPLVQGGWKDKRGGPLRLPRLSQASAGAAPMHARPHVRLTGSAPSAAWPPAPHRPLRRKPGVQWDPTARPSRGGGRAVTSLGGARWAVNGRGVGPSLSAHWSMREGGRGDCTARGGVPACGVRTRRGSLVSAPRLRNWAWRSLERPWPFYFFTVFFTLLCDTYDMQNDISQLCTHHPV